ncbi:MAG TPA: MiaB/RimO family radical SAM methylthiotransferase [Anaerolineales bacterium]|jgi:threonylcarbamoyladenosine tRNA methylthiotransferase MtaB
MRVYLDTVGCRLNQAEIEVMARQFRADGHVMAASAASADLAVINTCAVTNDAASESRRRIRHMARAGVEEIVVTGCWATLQPQAAAALPGVTRVVANDRKEDLAGSTFARRSAPPSEFELEPLARQPLPGLHHRTRAFIKIQDGCNNHCTFCVTTIARGEARSRTQLEVLADIRFALAGGAREIVLTGVHLGSWGLDLGSNLRRLVAAVLLETDVPRLRLSSLEPWDLDAEFFALWEDPRLMPHLHLPLQSGCAATLKRMRRQTTPASFRALVSAARRVMPEAAITTDIIAGFPGETQAEFAESLNFVREMGFAGGHVFTYSQRPGTGAARMRGQIRPELRKERNHVLHQTLEASAESYRKRFVGRRLSVLWESTSELGDSGWQMQGLSGNYLRVSAPAPSPRWNEIDEVELIESGPAGMQGVLCPEPAEARGFGSEG